MADDDIAELDLERGRGAATAQAIYCEHKSPDQVHHIAERVGERPDVTTIFTRADPSKADAVLEVLPDAFHDRWPGCWCGLPACPSRPASC